MDFATALTQSTAILTEGAVLERLRRDGPLPLDPVLLHAAFVLDPVGRQALAALHGQYLAIGLRHRLPFISLTTTWRANPDRLRQAGHRGAELNQASVRLLRQLHADCGSSEPPLYVGGLLGCRGDAYQPREALSVADAAAFHRWQSTVLAEAGVDFLFGATLPAVSEAEGMARAFARTGTPYVISFILQHSGDLLDGTPLGEAMAQIDAGTHPRPLGYMVNCCYPTFLAPAWHRLTPAARERFLGLQANGSSRSAEELDGSPTLCAETPEVFAADLLRLRAETGLRVLGGCCGTDHRHIECLAAQLAGQQG